MPAQGNCAEPLRIWWCVDTKAAAGGDYMNLSPTTWTYSVIDNASPTGTGFSVRCGAEQSFWPRSRYSMIPDIRYTPNPNDAAGQGW